MHKCEIVPGLVHCSKSNAQVLCAYNYNTQNSSKQNKDKASNGSAETSALHGIRVLRSRGNRRGSKRRQGTRAVATAATVSATSEEEDNGSDEVPAQSGGDLAPCDLIGQS